VGQFLVRVDVRRYVHRFLRLLGRSLEVDNDTATRDRHIDRSIGKMDKTDR
jgi:hypothetical protein